jgi:hypothetical protein
MASTRWTRPAIPHVGAGRSRVEGEEEADQQHQRQWTAQQQPGAKPPPAGDAAQEQSCGQELATGVPVASRKPSRCGMTASSVKLPATTSPTGDTPAAPRTLGLLGGGRWGARFGRYRPRQPAASAR